MINRSSLSASRVGLRADGPATMVGISNSVILGSVTTEQIANGGRAVSYGDNQTVANGSGTILH
jgi:hypothetical protein